MRIAGEEHLTYSWMFIEDSYYDHLSCIFSWDNSNQESCDFMSLISMIQWLGKSSITFIVTACPFPIANHIKRFDYIYVRSILKNTFDYDPNSELYFISLIEVSIIPLKNVVRGLLNGLEVKHISSNLWANVLLVVLASTWNIIPSVMSYLQSI